MITESLKSAASVPNPPEGKATLFVDLDGKHKMKMPDGSVVEIGGASAGAIYITSDRLAAIALRDAAQLQAGAFYWLEDVNVLIQALSDKTFAPTARHLKSTAGQSLTYGLLNTVMAGEQSIISSIVISDKKGVLNTQCIVEPVTIYTSDLEAGAVLVAAAINANVNCGWTATAIKHAVVLKNNTAGIQFNGGSVVATTDGKATFDFVAVSEGRESTARWYDVVYDPETITYMAGVDPVSLPGFFNEIYDPEYNVRVTTSKNLFLQQGLYFIEAFPFGSPRFKNCVIKNVLSMQTVFVTENANISMVTDQTYFINTVIDGALDINAPSAMFQKTLVINGTSISGNLLGTGIDSSVIDGCTVYGSITNSTFQNYAAVNSQVHFEINQFEISNHNISEMRVSYIDDGVKGSVSVYKGVDMLANGICELGLVPNNALVYEVISNGENMTTNNVGVFLYTDKDNALIESVQFANLASSLRTIPAGLVVYKTNTTAKILLKDLAGAITQGQVSITFNYIKRP